MAREVRGFTLLEVIVSIIILTAVVTAILPGYNDFAARVNLRRNAQEVALAIREAQASAFAVRGFDDDNNPVTPHVFVAWGAYFDITINNSLAIFVDVDGGKDYDSGELVRTVPISNSIKINRLCKGLKTSETDDCTIGRLDVIYQRPNPDTTLRADLFPVSGGGTYADLEIVLETADGSAESTIVVWSTGQISVE